jgi:protoporphyrinogen oxidase/glycosyltransferase involved in cell wall biosynthesis
MQTLIVLSHLRWDFVYQRPQHLLSRLAEHYKILFFEEPKFHEREHLAVMSTPHPNVMVCRPHTPVKAAGFHDDQLPYLRPLLRQLVSDHKSHIAWFYTPMALPLLAELDPSLIVYDCMDELSAFKNAPKQLLQRENALFKVADIVFTGGPGLFRAKRERHPHVHCFPSSVDIAHFSQALDRTAGDALYPGMPRPRLGYYGVIDERVDLGLIAELADAHPEWQIVLVGPIVKINVADVPKRSNIHYLGQQSYESLPKFLASWDLCLLPFALNESTRFISPTKTLEYMVAELPVISTHIADVVELYGKAVSIASSRAEFISACEQALDEKPDEKKNRVEITGSIVSANSWTSTSDRMHSLMSEALEKRSNSRLTAGRERSRRDAGSTATNYECIILGAGPTGLSAAYHLGKNTLLLDKNATVGGWCRSIEDKGFTFDHAGHIMFSNDDYVQKLYKILLGNNVHWQNREAWVYSKGVYTRYPFQGALYGLPPKVIKECIVGAMEARFGESLSHDKPAKVVEAVESRNNAASTSDAGNDCCADGTVTIASTTSAPAQVAFKKDGSQNFEQFIYKMWGKGIAKHFAIPYNKKLWTVPLCEMETSWLGGRVPLPDLEEIIEGALEPVAKPMGPNARFGYPLKGGFQAMMSGFLPHIKGKIELSAEIVEVSPGQRLVTLADGRVFRYEALVSTIPLPELIKMIGAEAPQRVQDAANGLCHISVRCVNLGIAREKITDKHWIYYPENTIFHRIFVQGNASPACNPPGGFGLTCEITYSPWKPLPVDGQELIDRCWQDCIEVGLLSPDDRLITANLVDMPYAYVVYDHQRSKNVATIRTWLAEHDIILAGRYSEWEYYNSDHAFLAGKKAAESLGLTAVAEATHF